MLGVTVLCGGCAAPSTAGPRGGLWGQAGLRAALRKLVPRFPDFNSSCLCQLPLKFCIVEYVVARELKKKFKIVHV